METGLKVISWTWLVLSTIWVGIVLYDLLVPGTVGAGVALLFVAFSTITAIQPIMVLVYVRQQQYINSYHAREALKEEIRAEIHQENN